ncbi:hypothetical protein IFJ82_09840 [Novacetimonas hansenii]|uniref:hypothetical protein n=1 Tax=Novacetimonas hansenii TaxID=436 RepID=UPI00177AA78B|nr:hypothetical protein [Novacetimonas hansenii]QOF94252.1 hypothetical protein IFJ82_09840 [Novacetimonas hansenii]
MSNEQLIGSILLVANAVQAWVMKMSSTEHHGRSEIIEEKLRENLRSVFDPKKVCFSPIIPGRSKSHTLSAMVFLKDDRSAIFDVVTPFSASICPAFTKMSDIKNSETPPNFLGIVIENHEAWRSDDLSLLRSSATDIIDINNGLPRKLVSLAA